MTDFDVTEGLSFKKLSKSFGLFLSTLSTPYLLRLSVKMAASIFNLGGPKSDFLSAFGFIFEKPDPLVDLREKNLASNGYEVNKCLCVCGNAKVPLVVWLAKKQLEPGFQQRDKNIFL